MIAQFIFLLLLLPAVAQAQDAAPDAEFSRLSDHITRDAPSQELIDRIYAFMEKYPKDPRSDQIQYWTGLIQQKRKFHNEAIKELGYVISDFPKSRFVLAAHSAQAQSYLAVGKPDDAARCYQQIVDSNPADLNVNRDSAAAFREALLFLAGAAIEKKDIDAAVAHYMRLPDRTEAITRAVQLYISTDRHEDALNAIGRLSEAERFLAYRLTAITYGTREGSANLFKLLSRVIEKEKPAAPVDNILQQIAKVIAKKGKPDESKALSIIADKYERLRRWAHFALCEIHKREDSGRLLKFIGDYRSGGDVETVKTHLGEFWETAGDVKKAQDAYWLLEDRAVAHFLVAQTYYGKLAKNRDLPAGEKELSEIVRRFYSNTTSAEALTRRAELQAGLMKNPQKAIVSLNELIDRFPSEGRYPENALMRLGALHRSIKQPDEAIKSYEKLILRYPESGQVRAAWLGIAYCHEDKSDARRAIDVLRSIMRKFPRTSEASAAHTRLEQVYKIPDVDVSDR